MRKPINSYEGEQYDDIEKLLEDAEKLLSNPNTRTEGKDLLALANAKISREKNRMAYAAMTGQKPNIPPLEPAPVTKQISNS